MNSLVFNPSIDVIEEWSSVYIYEKEVGKFENIIDQTYMYLDVIANNKLIKSKYTEANESSLNNQGNDQLKSSVEVKKESILEERNIEESITEIKKLKIQFEDQYKEIL